MKKEIQKQKKENKGITLVALVVTIVVLLILAGITISTLFGDNGIISAARKAAELTKNSVNDTDKALNNLNNYLNSQLNGIVEPKNIEDWVYEKDETTNTIKIKKYKGHDKEVVIPNYIGGIKVKSIGIGHGYYDFGNYDSLWDNSLCTDNNINYGSTQEDITKVIISEGIEQINDSCFGNSKALKEVIIPNSVKSIEGYAFFGCTSLTNITIPSSVTSIGGATFYECTSLTNITIPSSITSIGYSAFYRCTSLTNITIPSSVTTMESNVFYEIPSITVTVPFTSGNQPSGWNSRWNFTYGGTVNVVYQQ